MRSRNPTLKRLRYVAAQGYPDHVLTELIAAGLHAAGEDALADETRENLYEFASFKPRDVLDEPKGSRTTLGSLLGKLRSPFDKMLPWYARELQKLDDELVADGHDDLRTWVQVTAPLAPKAPAMAQWFERERPDLDKWELNDVLEQLDLERVRLSSKEGPEGEVIMRWSDGYTLVQLGPEALSREGELMQNCLRHDAYRDEVERKTSAILSLRDEYNRPHVDIKLDKAWDGRGVIVEQVFGKQNDDPMPKYWSYIGDLLSMLPLHHPDLEDAVTEISTVIEKVEDDAQEAASEGRAAVRHLRRVQSAAPSAKAELDETEDALKQLAYASSLEGSYGDAIVWYFPYTLVAEHAEELDDWIWLDEPKGPRPELDLAELDRLVERAASSWTGLSWSQPTSITVEGESFEVDPYEFSSIEDRGERARAIEARVSAVLAEMELYSQVHDDRLLDYLEAADGDGVPMASIDLR